MILDEVLDHRDRRRQSPKAHSAVALFLRAGSASKVHPYDIQQAFWINELFLNRKDTAPPSTQNTRSKWDDLTAGLQRLSGQRFTVAFSRRLLVANSQSVASTARRHASPRSVNLQSLAALKSCSPNHARKVAHRQYRLVNCMTNRFTEPLSILTPLNMPATPG